MTSLPLTQSVTYWAPTGTDGDGTITYAAGVTVPARWVRKDGIVPGAQGNDQKTELVVYATAAIPERSLVTLDGVGGATPPATARRVLSEVYNPSISNLRRFAL